MTTATFDDMVYLQSQATQAILMWWKADSGRIGGTMAIAFLGATPAAMSALITRVAGLGISMNDVPRWLNSNQQEVLQILAG
jgi:hypothetical protein